MVKSPRRTEYASRRQRRSVGLDWASQPRVRSCQRAFQVARMPDTCPLMPPSRYAEPCLAEEPLGAWQGHWNLAHFDGGQ